MKYLDRKLIERVDKMLAEDIAKLMSLVPLEEQISKTEGSDRSVLFTYIYSLPWLENKGDKLRKCNFFKSNDKKRIIFEDKETSGVQRGGAMVLSPPPDQWSLWFPGGF